LDKYIQNKKIIKAIKKIFLYLSFEEIKNFFIFFEEKVKRV